MVWQYYEPLKKRWTVIETDIHTDRQTNRKRLKREMNEIRYIRSLWSKIEKKLRQNSHLIIHCPTSEGVSEVSERANE